MNPIFWLGIFLNPTSSFLTQVKFTLYYAFPSSRIAKRLLSLHKAFGRRARSSSSAFRVYNYTMPPPPGPRQSSLESTPPLSQLLVTELGQLEAGANTYTHEMKEEKREEANEEEERVRANPSSASLDSKHETGATQIEPGSEFVVWWDEPHDQDPDNPMNWSSTRRWFNICVISFISFLV